MMPKLSGHPVHWKTDDKRIQQALRKFSEAAQVKFCKGNILENSKVPKELLTFKTTKFNKVKILYLCYKLVLGAPIL